MDISLTGFDILFPYLWIVFANKYTKNRIRALSNIKFEFDSVFLVVSISMLVLLITSFPYVWISNNLIIMIIIFPIYLTALVLIVIIVLSVIVERLPSHIWFYVGGVAIFIAIAVTMAFPRNYVLLLQGTNFGGFIPVEISLTRNGKCEQFSNGKLAIRTNDALIIKNDAGHYEELFLNQVCRISYVSNE